MKIIPLADRVVIKTVEVEETTKGGLILTGSAKEKPQVAQVVAVGPGGVVDGKEVKMTVKVGDKVLTSKYSGTEVKVDGEECTIVRQADILVAAVGRPRMIHGNWIKPGAAVIDVGINKIPAPDKGEGKMRTVGDVDYASALPVAPSVPPAPALRFSIIAFLRAALALLFKRNSA